MKKETEIQCPVCDGWGYRLNPDWHVCPRCEGRGGYAPKRWPDGETFIWFAAGVCFVIALVLS